MKTILKTKNYIQSLLNTPSLNYIKLLSSITLVLFGFVFIITKLPLNISCNNFIYSIEDFKYIYSQIIENINNFQDYFNSFDAYHQFYLYNIMFTTTLLMSLFYYISGLYANYLLDKLDLQNKIPILARLLRYRLQYQKYYF